MAENVLSSKKIYLEKKLNQINLVKKLITKAGLRCEILTTGKISVGDIIRQND